MKHSGKGVVLGLVAAGIAFAAATWLIYQRENPTDPDAALIQDADGWRVEARFPGREPAAGTRLVITLSGHPGIVMSATVTGAEGTTVARLDRPPPPQARPGPCRATIDAATAP